MDKGKKALMSEAAESIWAVIEESARAQVSEGNSSQHRDTLLPPLMRGHDFEQNDIRRLRNVWYNMERQEEFNDKYGDIAALMFIAPDTQMLKAMLRFWDPSYRCFTFREFDLVPTIEEYAKLLNKDNMPKDKVYSHDPKKTPRRTLSKLIGVQVNELNRYMKDGGRSLDSEFLLRIIETQVDQSFGLVALALAIYGLVIFPRVKNQIDGHVINLFEQIDNGVHPAPPILAETIRSLNYCQIHQKGRFWGCASLLAVWMLSHLPTLKCFGHPEINLKQFVIPKHPLSLYGRDNWPSRTPMMGQWISFFAEMKEVVWRAKWFPLTYTIYRCGSKPWVPLIGPWGVVSYAPAMVRRQMASLQFIPMTHGLSKYEFSYDDEGIDHKVKEVIGDWKDVRSIKPGLPSSKTTEDYPIWQAGRKKGFLAPKVQGPEPPMHQFNEPIDYHAEAEGRYEIICQQWATERRFLKTQLDTARERIQNQEHKIVSKEIEIEKLRETCQVLEAIIQGKDGQLEGYRAEVEILNQQKNKLENDVIFLTNEKDFYLNASQDMKRRAEVMINNVREISNRSRKRAREILEVEAKLIPGETQELLTRVRMDLNFLGKFH